MDYLFAECKTPKLFTSTNQSNKPMQKLLGKTGFTFCGQIDALDEGDPEMFYVKQKPV
jgi:RimJ/RimL family protein N-acetyltransferase